MIAARTTHWAHALAVLGLIAVAAPAAAAQTSTPARGSQPSQQPAPGMFQGMQKNSDQPVKIESNSLEVRDKDNKATFFGNVQVTQGDTILRCKKLIVFYEQSTTPTPPGQKKSGGQQIKQAEAEGNVIVIQADQTATGDKGLFDMKSNTVKLMGNVVVTQGQNVIRGDTLYIDLTTGLSRVESGKGTRVESLIVPGQQQNGQSGATGPAKDAKQAAPQRPH